MSLYRRTKTTLQIADVSYFNMDFMKTLFQCLKLGTKRKPILSLFFDGCNFIWVWYSSVFIPLKFTIYGNILLFDQLDESLLKAISKAGFENPTQVQTETLEPALNGTDLFVSAETGSGKTCAYLLPTFERLLNSQDGAILALVIVPTRELAQQVFNLLSHTFKLFSEFFFLLLVFFVIEIQVTT